MCSRCLISYDLERDYLLVDPPSDRLFRLVNYHLNACKIQCTQFKYMYLFKYFFYFNIMVWYNWNVKKTTLQRDLMFYRNELDVLNSFEII